MRNQNAKLLFPPKTKDYLIALTSYPTFLKCLAALGSKPYSSLLDWLLKNEKELMDEDIKLPSMKELADETGIKQDRLVKYLKDIYEDIIELNWNQPTLFVKPGQHSCLLNFDYLGCKAYFILGLNVIPRVDETFGFDFLKPKNGGRNYYVRRVQYNYTNNGQEIIIYLTGGEANLYLRLLREKAYLRGNISLMEFIDPTDANLEEKLIKLYSNL